MTPVDAYDTTLLMGLDAEAADGKRLIIERLAFDRNVAAAEVLEPPGLEAGPVWRREERGALTAAGAAARHTKGLKA